METVLKTFEKTQDLCLPQDLLRRMIFTDDRIETMEDMVSFISRDSNNSMRYKRSVYFGQRKEQIKYIYHNYKLK